MVETQPLPCAATCPIRPVGIPLCHLGMLFAKEIDIFDCAKTVGDLQLEYSQKPGVTGAKLVASGETITVLVTTANSDYLRRNPKKAWTKAAQIKDGFIPPCK